MNPLLRFRTIAALFLALLFTAAALPQSVDELIAQGDQLAMKDFKNEKALEKFLAAEKLAPNNWEVLWRLSRTYVDIAEHMPGGTDAQKDAQLAKFQLSLEYANKTIKNAGDKSIGYLRKAIANGRIALFKGVWSALGIVKEVKNDVEKAIQLGNGGTEVQATAHYVLGRTHFKVCEKPYLVRVPLGLGWGDMDVAIDNLKKAVSLRSNYRMFYFELAKAYVEEDEYQKAKELLYKIPSLPVQDEDDDKVAQDARALLDQVKNK